MSIPPSLTNGMMLPVIAAPMFLASGPQLVTECCKAGILGTFPALNQRSSAGFEEWLTEISSILSEHEDTTGRIAAPFGVNLVAHKSNGRLQEDLALCVKHKVPLIITSLGIIPDLISKVQDYGGAVFHDVTTIGFANKAVTAGVDGLILVCNGAGGHAGSLNPFAFVNEARQIFDKTIVLSGCISRGADIAATQAMGADLAYMGTRFLATRDSMVGDGYKDMVLQSNAADIVYTPAVSGVPASFMRQSLVNAGYDPDNKTAKPNIDFGVELDIDQQAEPQESSEAKPWRDIWSAGQGVGAINSVPEVSELIAQLQQEYRNTLQGLSKQALPSS